MFPAFNRRDFLNHVLPSWRNHYLAASMFNLRGTEHADNDLIKQTRQVLSKT